MPRRAAAPGGPHPRGSLATRAVGYPAPAFVGKGLQDEEIDLQKEAGLGRCVLLDFWASWCGPCRGEFPTLKALREQYGDKGLRIIGVNLDEKKEDALKAVQENGLEYPHVFDGKGWRNAVAALYRVNGIPATFLLDKDLNIVAKDLRGEALISRVGEMLNPGETPEDTGPH